MNDILYAESMMSVVGRGLMVKVWLRPDQSVKAGDVVHVSYEGQVRPVKVRSFDDRWQAVDPVTAAKQVVMVCSEVR